MQITKIIVDRITPKDLGICAEVSILLDDVLSIHNIHVINGKKGLFISFPNTGQMRMFNGRKRYKDIVHPTSKTLREEIESQVLTAYNEEILKL